MELTIIILLIVLAVLFQQKKMLSGVFIFVSGIMTLAFGLTTNQIASITNGVIEYSSIDPLVTWVIGLALLTISIIHFLDLA